MNNDDKEETKIFCHSHMILFYDMKSNLHVFTLKCVSNITNISIEH